jgi:hypothetical protein
MGSLTKGPYLSAHTKVLQRASILVTLSKHVNTYLGFVLQHQQSTHVFKVFYDLLDATFG